MRTGRVILRQRVEEVAVQPGSLALDHRLPLTRDTNRGVEIALQLPGERMNAVVLVDVVEDGQVAGVAGAAHEQEMPVRPHAAAGTGGIDGDIIQQGMAGRGHESARVEVALRGVMEWLAVDQDHAVDILVEVEIGRVVSREFAVREDRKVPGIGMRMVRNIVTAPLPEQGHAGGVVIP